MPTEARGSDLLKTEAAAPQDNAGEAGRRPEPDDEDPTGQFAKDGYIKFASPRRPLEAIAEAAASPQPKRGGPRLKASPPGFGSPFAAACSTVTWGAQGPATPGGVDWAGLLARGTPTPKRAEPRRRTPPKQPPSLTSPPGARLTTPGRRSGRSPDDLRLDFCLSPLDARSPPYSSRRAPSSLSTMTDLLPPRKAMPDDDLLLDHTAARTLMEVAASPARVARSPVRHGQAPPVPTNFRARGYRRPSRGAQKVVVMPPTPGGQSLGPPVQSTPSPTMQPQSKRKRGREGKALASTSFKPCNCKKSKCLKLYCECYAAGVFCRDCNCVDCLNKTDEPMPLSSYPASDPRGRVRHIDVEAAPEVIRHSAQKRKPQSKQRQESGCFCKKSRCLKKYCECFERGEMCEQSCRCENCQNYPGSEELAAARARGGGRGAKSRRVSTSSARKQTPVGAPRVTLASPSQEPALPSLPFNEAAPRLAAARAVVRAKRSAAEALEEAAARDPLPKKKKAKTPAQRSASDALGELKTSQGDVRSAKKAFGEDAHAAFVARQAALEAGEGTLGVAKSAVLRAFDTLPSEDLYGACLVSRRWNELALDRYLWGFF